LDRLDKWLDAEQLNKLAPIDNDELHEFLAVHLELCRPSRVFVCADSPDEVAYIRAQAVRNGEEHPLALAGHTIHFDGYSDQGRDKGSTRFLLPKGIELGAGLNTVNKEEGLRELGQLADGIMAGKEAYVRFFCLGPANSVFSIPCVQVTDSAYVAHSEDLLYRPGYQEFVRQGGQARFFRFLHSAGELDERKTSRNPDQRRVYIDCAGGAVYSLNTQYGGNTIGLKKLAMRLAIFRASTEGWLTEHMLLMGVNGPGGRVSYVAGAFPSMCGKTSTAMIPWERLVGDDIAYLRVIGGKARAVNVEQGMFGIIMGVNKTDDPLLWETLHSPGEVIFSNVLLGEEGRPYWIDMGEPVPEKGSNHSGSWQAGKKDEAGNEISPSHKNARVTVGLRVLKNWDPVMDDPCGVELKALLYGGRDSDTWVPVREAFDWVHGIVTMAASLESETTAATIGKEGLRELNPASNIDFVSVPLERYLRMNLEFGAGLSNPPRIYGINYFLKDRQGRFLSERTDKAVWLKWIELRVNGDVAAIRTPTGFIPRYEDLERLFRSVLHKAYTRTTYVAQFTLRIPECLAKIDRVVTAYRQRVKDAPAILYEVLEQDRQRLLDAQRTMGDNVEPERFPVVDYTESR
jgi:phosphoenolpyruvate carboxykinase (GTP)